MNTERVTIRGVESEAINGLREAAKYNSITLGYAVSEAIELWLDSLDDDDEEAPSNTHDATFECAPITVVT